MFEPSEACSRPQPYRVLGFGLGFGARVRIRVRVRARVRHLIESRMSREAFNRIILNLKISRCQDFKMSRFQDFKMSRYDALD